MLRLVQRSGLDPKVNGRYYYISKWVKEKGVSILISTPREGKRSKFVSMS